MPAYYALNYAGIFDGGLPPILHPYISACGVDKKQSKTINQ